MLGQIAEPKAFSPSKGKKLDKKTKKTYDTKLIQWLIVTNSFSGLIKSIYTIDFMSHVSNLDFCSDIWTKFEHLY